MIVQLKAVAHTYDVTAGYVSSQEVKKAGMHCGMYKFLLDLGRKFSNPRYPEKACAKKLKGGHCNCRN